MSAMREAMTAAGFVPPEERLMRVAIEAWGKWPKTEASGARRDYVAEKLRGEMTWSLIQQWQPSTLGQAIGWMLNRAFDEIRKAKPVTAPRVVGGGHPDHGTQARLAPANPFKPDTGRKPVGGGHGDIVSQRHTAPATPSRVDVQPKVERRSEPANCIETPKVTTPAAPSLTALADKQSARMATALKVEVRMSRLDTVIVGGKPIGDCTVSEVRSWADQRANEQRQAGRDVRFAMAMIANLPSNAVIREWWKNGTEVDAIYERAEAENAA